MLLGQGGAPTADAVIRDPVCGMTVDPAAGKPIADAWRPDVPFLQRGLPGEIRRAIRKTT